MSYHYVYYSYEEFGRGYIGSRSCKRPPEEDTNYFGSYRDQTFNPTEKIILGTFETSDESLEAEGKLMELFEVENNPHFANRQRNPSQKFCVLRGDKNGMFGRTHTDEVKERLREQRTGTKHSEETKRKMSKTRTGVKRPQSGEAISKALKGKKFSPEHRRKISEARKGKPTGRKMSEEQKLKMLYARHPHLNPDKDK